MVSFCGPLAGCLSSSLVFMKKSENIRHACEDKPFIRETPDSKSLHFSEREIQSRMSLLNPDALEIEYTRMMMGFLVFNSAPGRIAMIGLGGGSLPKFCYRYLPGSDIEVVEIDPAVIELRDAFQIPKDGPRFRVVQADGADYVCDSERLPDILMVDGFDLDGMPEQLCSQEFYEDCHDFLAPEGIMVVNLHLNRAGYADCVARIRNTFGAAVFEVVDDDMTNSIVFARKGELFDMLGQVPLCRPDSISRDAWRQLMPTFQIIAATLTLR